MTANIFDLSPIKTKLSKYCVDVENITHFQAGINELEHWGALCFLSFLQKNHLFTSKQCVHDIEDIEYHLNIKPKYSRILLSLMSILVEYGHISKLQEDLYEGVHTGNITASELERLLNNIIHRYPEVIEQANFLQKAISSYPKVLSGEDCFLNIIFPAGSVKIIERIYKLNPETSFFNKLAAHTIKYYASMHKPVSIIEIGSGIGVTTSYVLPILHESKLCSRYMYTDISKTFTRYGEHHFQSAYPFTSFATLNIDVAPKKQGINEQYDIVIASNVLHATKNITKTLTHVKDLLKSGGMLVLAEGITKKNFSTLAYGLIDGWWAFEDDGLRIPGSPFINEDNWKKTLRTSGFKNITSLSQLTNPQISEHQDVIVAFV